MTETVLIFPAGLPASLRYREEATARGASVIGASSVSGDTARGVYPDWEYLPYVHDQGFESALAALLDRRGVSAVYAPHEVVAGVLVEVLARRAPDVALIAPDPALAYERAYSEMCARAAYDQKSVAFHCDNGQSALTLIERAALVRLVDTIPGMTDLDKIAAVLEAMRFAPPGDVVEVGSWWGRSAALLLLAARRYRLGHVLCVDPWLSEYLDQGVGVLDQASARMDTDQALRMFQINLSPLSNGQLNYLRAPSVEAASRYAPGLTVTSEVFGETRYEGRIAFLHIDGNHTYENVQADAAAWTPHVRPGGWIVFDDYVWAFGDGPRRVGDAFIEDNANRIALSYVAGTALFVKLAE